jgi:hypothetical protein
MMKDEHEEQLKYLLNILYIFIYILGQNDSILLNDIPNIIYKLMKTYFNLLPKFIIFKQF